MSAAAQPMSESDDDLLKRATIGDGDALAILLERYGPSVRSDVAGRIPGRLRSLLSDDDVMQQTYADAFRGISRFVSQGDGSFARWLATLARCNVRDAVKMLEAQKRGGRSRRTPQPTGVEPFIFLFEDLAATGSTPSQHAARAEARADIEAAIATLPPQYARVVQMYDIEGRPIDEVAAALERTPGAVYMLRSRAHDRLRDTLGRTSKYFGPGA